MGLAALSTENFGSAVEQMARYKQLTCPEEILQEKDEEEWSIQFRWLLADEVEPPVLNECCFAWVLSIARCGTGTRLSPLRVEFVQPRSHVKTIERHFGCPVVCGGVSQRDRVSRSRCAAPVGHAQCRTSGNAGTAVRRRAEAAKQRRGFHRERAAERYSENSLAGVPRSKTSPTRYTSALALCSGACRMQDPASSAHSKKLAISWLATISTTPS